jgi:hypothetical protein
MHGWRSSPVGAAQAHGKSAHISDHSAQKQNKNDEKGSVKLKNE